MRLAWLYPEPGKTAPGRKAVTASLSVSEGVKASRLSQARAVLRHSRELARQVRDVLKGQRAMRLAWLYPEAEKGGRGKKSEARKALETSGFSRQRLDQARAVLRHSRELARQVRDVREAAPAPDGPPFAQGASARPLVSYFAAGLTPCDPARRKR
jgi:hypothetical protein